MFQKNYLWAKVITADSSCLYLHLSLFAKEESAKRFCSILRCSIFILNKSLWFFFILKKTLLKYAHIAEVRTYIQKGCIEFTKDTGIISCSINYLLKKLKKYCINIERGHSCFQQWQYYKMSTKSLYQNDFWKIMWQC